MSAEEIERLGDELEQLDATYAANVQHFQSASDRYNAQLESLPTAIRNDIPQDGGQALLYLAERFEIDQDFFTGNDISKRASTILLSGRRLPLKLLAWIQKSAPTAITKQHDDGTLEINLRDPDWIWKFWEPERKNNNAYTAQAYVGTVIDELGGGRHVQYITTRDNLTRAIHEHQKNLTDAEPNRLAHRQKYADQFRQTVRDRRIIRGEVDRPD